MGDFERWLREGLDRGWCGAVVCSTHDGTPTTAEEDDEFFEGDGEPCIPVVRVYGGDAAVKAAVEANHSPSVWRGYNQNSGNRSGPSGVDTSTRGGVASST